LASKLKTIWLIVVLIALIWFVGAVIMTTVYEHERRSICIRTEGTLEGLRWCESDVYSREDLGFLYKDILILGLGWPSYLISSEHTSIEMLSKIPNSRGKEEMPPVGENQALNDPQVRWCVFEKVRIEMMRFMLTTDQEVVGTFNTYATRHNKRCNRFQFQHGTLGVIERELIFEGKRLQSEGAQRIRSSLKIPEN